MMVPPALRHRPFAVYWMGILISLSGHFLGLVVRGWLVNELTHSSVWLGGVYAMVGLPQLVLGPLAGALIDRVDRRKVLFVTQMLQGCNALALGLTVMLGVVSPALLLLFAALSGTIGTFDWTVRLAIVPNLVPAASLDSAIGLSTTARIVAGVAGPALAGSLLARIGAANCFFVTAAGFIPSVLIAYRMSPTLTVRRRKEETWVQSALDGFGYIVRNRLLWAVIVLEAVPVVLGLPFTTLFPILAEQAARAGFGVKETALGFLHGTLGAGAIVGAVLASTGARKIARGKALLVSTSLFGFGLIGFAAAKPFAVSLAWLLAVGVIESMYATLSATLVQRITEDSYRGRVMSLYNMIWGLTPIGGLSMGLGAKAVGPAAAIALHGTVIVLVVLALAAAIPKLRRVQ